MNYLKIVLLITLVLTIQVKGYSQLSTDTGKIEFIQDKKISELITKHIHLNEKAGINGYRIKIHFGADKNVAKEIKVNFLSIYPTVPAYEKYDQPNFNIRVGNFRTKLEAYKFLKQIQSEFPSAFIVQDEIEFPTIGTAQKTN
jgi:hypothetical protein